MVAPVTEPVAATRPVMNVASEDANPSGARLPALRPVVPGRSRRRSSAGEPAPTIEGLLRAVIVAVNARGLCATEAAKIALLPSGDRDDIAALCRCARCLKLRAN